MSTIIVLAGVLFIVCLAIQTIQKERKCNTNGCFGCSKCDNYKNLKEMYKNDFQKTSN